MFCWVVHVTLPFFIKLDFSQSLILIVLVYIGGTCTFPLALFMIFFNGPPFYTLVISSYYVSNDGDFVPMACSNRYF